MFKYLKDKHSDARMDKDVVNRGLKVRNFR